MPPKNRAWNKALKNVRMACWNPWGLCNERLNYCKMLKFDILGLTELHNIHNKKAWRGRHWITSDDVNIDEEGNLTDSASGVGILLSRRFSSKILAKGSIGSRIVWVRLQGPVCPLFVVCAYVPHMYRKSAPFAEDIIQQISDLLAKSEELKPNDCVVLMGDFNCELQRNVAGCTGRWFMNKRPDKGHSAQVMSLLRDHDLFAVDSLFKPKRKYMFNPEIKRKRVCGATYLQKDISLRPKKLDYFFVSNRWRSSVTNSSTNWAPSFHRFGKAFDHSLLQISWSWRVRNSKVTPTKDFKAMLDDDWAKLDAEIQKNFAKYPQQGAQENPEAQIDEKLKRLNTCVKKAIDVCVPAKKRLSQIKREPSERTRNIYDARAKKFSSILSRGGKVTKQLRKRWHRKIKDANLSDYNNWLDSMTTKMEEANKIGDSESIFRIVKIISGLITTATSQAPAVKKDGGLILDQQELAKVWQTFLTDKFKATNAELERDAYAELGPQLIADPLTEQAFVRALKKLKKGKACGPDGIPGEVYYNSQTAALELYQLLKVIWEREYVPAELVRASFVMLYKNKGSANDPSKYRCIGLLPHAYKILSLIMLERIADECSEYLADWQAGFRPERGCRDNVLLLRVLFDQVIKDDRKLLVTYIDYSAAFDTVSHKFLDESLKQAKATRKTRAMFRAIYAAAEGTARVRGLDGEHIYSDSFKVRRGVIQGDIISPIFFILAMEQIFRNHDKSPTGTKIGNYLQIGVLGYADDVAIISESADSLTNRVTNISKGSSADADMHINTGKTKSMHVERQVKLALPTRNEVTATAANYKHECEFCGRRFKTARGMKIHVASCDSYHGTAEDVDEIKRINATFGTPQHRWYRVEWKGHPGEDSWEPERSLLLQNCEASIKSFWEQSDMDPTADFIADPDDVWRCWTCGKGYTSHATLATHVTREHTEQTWRGSSADKDTRMQQHKDAQDAKEHVKCEDKELDNVWLFKYLGSLFRADGDQYTDVKARIAAATTTAGKMRNIWASTTIPLSLKLRIYRTGVCSRLTYGCEAWKLDVRTCKMLNGANSRMMSRITAKTIHEEASRETRTFDVVGWVRARRLQWVGHILRMDEKRMVYKTLQHIYENKSEGDLLMDLHDKYSWRGLLMLADNRSGWKKRVQALKNGLGKPVVDKPADSTHHMQTRSQTLPKTGNTSTTTTTRANTKATKTNAQKYQARDAHEILFRPNLKARAPKRRQVKKKKPKGLTDKQRRAEATAHYIIHHGTAKDATHFLGSKSNNSNISADTHASLMLMTTNPFEPQAEIAAAPPTQLQWMTATGKKL